MPDSEKTIKKPTPKRIQTSSAFVPHQRIQTQINNPSQTKQSFVGETDINGIMRRFEKTGIIEHVNHYQGDYGDFTSAVDYQEALNQTIEAKELFLSLPARIRAKFENDPGAFLNFALDENNLDEMTELGLLPKQHRPTTGEARGSSQKETPEPAPEDPGEPQNSDKSASPS